MFLFSPPHDGLRRTDNDDIGSCQLNTFRFVLIGSFLLTSSGTLPRSCAQDELVELVTGLLADPDKELRALAFDQIRGEAKGEATTRKFAEMLPGFPAETQIGLLSALADRGDSAAVPAVRRLLSTTAEETVRVAAIEALGSLGSRDDLDLLLQSISTGSPSMHEAARASLVRLPADASSAMVAALRESPAETRIALLGILTARRAREAVPAMLETARNEDVTVREAAISALAQLADAEHVRSMIPLVLEAAPGRERDATERALAALCQRNTDQQEPAAPLLEAMQKLKDSEQTILLSTLGRIGGPAALKVVDDAVRSSRPELHEAGIRSLCNWPDGAVVSRLLRVARTDENAAQRNRALRALIRIAPLADERDDRRRLDTLRTVFVMCSSDAERSLVLERAKAIRRVDTLRFLVPFLEQPTLAQQACLTVVELAHHSSLRESNKDEFHAVLDQVIKISKDATVIDRARRDKTGQTWVRANPSK